MKVHLLAISDSDKHFHSEISEYLKRLSKTVTITNLRPIKHGTHPQIIAKETALLAEKLLHEKAKGHYIVLLAKEGKSLTTEQFTDLVTNHSALTFVIGGPYGVDEKQLELLIDLRLSFGAHTMPHGLAKLVLLEQLYRASTLIAGKEYHY